MKTIVILTGPSGCAKTTTIIPTLVKELDAEELGTGMVFKAMIGLAREPYYVSPGIKHVPTKEESLKWFYESGGLARGLEAYERAKKTNMNGFQICLTVEANLRSVCHDGPAKQVALLAGFSKKETIITDAVSEEELGYLIEAMKGHRIFVVDLDCLDPVKRNGDNRKPISDDFFNQLENVHKIRARYSLANSRKVANLIADAVLAVMEVDHE